jgi:tetratricopeptide (TPR) repeat protein
LILLGTLRFKNDDLEEAAKLLERGTRLAEQIESWRDLGEGKRALAKLAMRRGEFDQASDHAYTAVRLARRIRSRSQLSAALRTCAEVASRRPRNPDAGDRAARLYLRSIELAKRVGHDRELAKTYRAFARHAARYQSAEVRDKAQRLRDISEEIFARCAARDAA